MINENGKYQGLKDIKIALLYGFKIAGSINLFLIPAILLFGNYFNLIRSIDRAMLYFIPIGIFLYVMMTVGLIPGYYRQNYVSLTDALLLLSILMWNSLPRLIVFLWVNINDYSRGETRYDIVSSRNELKTLFDFDLITIIVFAISLLVFFLVFYTEKYVSFSEVHVIARSVRSDKFQKHIKGMTIRPDIATHSTNRNLVSVNTTLSHSQRQSVLRKVEPETLGIVNVKEDTDVFDSNGLDDILLRRTSR